jgi:hypothetical protein
MSEEFGMYVSDILSEMSDLQAEIYDMFGSEMFEYEEVEEI